jgi:hypothetical protein
MEVITQDQIEQWLRIDPSADEETVNMLVSAGVDHVEAITGRKVRPYTVTDPDTQVTSTVTPTVPQGLKHAISLFVSAHFDDRAGSNEKAMVAIRNLCQPFWVAPC